MEKSDEEKLQELTADPRLAEGDVELLRTALTGEGAIPITSIAQLEALGKAACAVNDSALEHLRAILTPADFAFIRKARVDDGYSWRAVAGAGFERLGKGQEEWWRPTSNQLIGMALCELAAQHFGEDYMQDPWN